MNFILKNITKSLHRVSIFPSSTIRLLSLFNQEFNKSNEIEVNKGNHFVIYINGIYPSTVKRIIFKSEESHLFFYYNSEGDELTGPISRRVFHYNNGTYGEIEKEFYGNPSSMKYMEIEYNLQGGIKAERHHGRGGYGREEDLPSITRYYTLPDGSQGSVKNESYYMDGELNRDSKPSVIDYFKSDDPREKGAIKAEFYYKNGIPYRERNQPAGIRYFENSDKSQGEIRKEEFFKEGEYVGANFVIDYSTRHYVSFE